MDIQVLIAYWLNNWKESLIDFCWKYKICNIKFKEFMTIFTDKTYDSNSEELYTAEIWALDLYYRNQNDNYSFLEYVKRHLVTNEDLLLKLSSKILKLNKVIFIDGDNWKQFIHKINHLISSYKTENIHIIIVFRKNFISPKLRGMEMYKDSISIMYSGTAERNATDITIAMLLSHIMFSLKYIKDTIKYYICSYDNFTLEIQNFFKNIYIITNFENFEKLVIQKMDNNSQPFYPETKVNLDCNRIIDNDQQILEIEEKMRSAIKNNNFDQIYDPELSILFKKNYLYSITGFCKNVGINKSNFSKWLKQKKHSILARSHVIEFLKSLEQYQ